MSPQQRRNRPQSTRFATAKQWMAQMTARTLNEMTAVERANMMSLVAQALESVAEDADEVGDTQSARNAVYLAGSIRGCGTGPTPENFRAVEILLEQGISYVASVSERLEQFKGPGDDAGSHDEIHGGSAAASQTHH
jgi:hypothetical protein